MIIFLANFLQYMPIILLVASHFLLFSEQESDKYTIDRNITITPLYQSKIPQKKEDLPGQIIQDDTIDQNTKTTRIKTDSWIFESSIQNAPTLLKGIISYLKNRINNNSPYSIIVPSFHRFILVGPPGSGKTTMAHAVAHILHYPAIFISATSFLGHYRNETAINISRFLKTHSSTQNNIVIIIDELHKLFEHHSDEHSDHSQSAATFWSMLDEIEKYRPNTIIIGTANNVSTLPPELKSRFSGKIITIPLPNERQKIRAFKNRILYDQTILINKSINNSFISKAIKCIHNCSLRDIQLIIDTAKMFYYAENTFKNEFPIILTKSHFQQALIQIKKERQILETHYINEVCETLKPWGSIVSTAANICLCVRTAIDIFIK